MTLHNVAVSAKDGAGATIPGGIRQNDTSGTGAGPNIPEQTLVDSTGAEILGTQADAAATQTDTTALSSMSVWKQISKSVQLMVFGAGTAAAAQRTTLASDDPAVAALGSTSGAAVITDVPGTLQQYLRGLVKLIAAGINVTVSNVLASGQALSAASAPVVIASDQSTLTTKHKSITGTQSIAASSATSVSVLASNASRLGATVFNDSTAILYLLLSTGGTASATVYTVQIAAGGYYEVPFGFTGALIGLWATANGNARVTELT